MRGAGLRLVIAALVLCLGCATASAGVAQGSTPALAESHLKRDEAALKVGQPGAGCAVTVSFAPTQAGAATGSFTVTDSVGTQSAVLSGTGITGATDSLSTTSLSFPGTVVGQSATPLTVQITNSGGLPLTGIGTSLATSFPNDFAAVSDCGSTLGAGASCGVTMTFRASVATNETGILTISDALRAQTVALSGVGLKPPVLAISPTTLSFGSSEVGVASAAKTVTISNTGGSPLASPGFALSGTGAAAFATGATTCGTTGVGQAAVPVQVTVTNPGSLSALTGLALSIDATGLASGFGLSGSTCTATLAAGASCTVNVGFVPSSARVLTGSLLVTSANGGAGGGQGTVSLTLAGVGYDFKLTVVGGSSMTVVQGQTAYYTLAVTALGSASGAVNFQCVKTPTNALCLFNPPQLAGLPANVAGNVRLGIATGAPTNASLMQQRGGPGWRGTAMLACGLAALPFMWRRRLRISMLCAMMLAGVLCGIAGCAGSGGSGGQSHLGGGTPQGSYKVTVNATSAGVTHSVMLTVVVN